MNTLYFLLSAPIMIFVAYLYACKKIDAEIKENLQYEGCLIDNRNIRLFVVPIFNLVGNSSWFSFEITKSSWELKKRYIAPLDSRNGSMYHKDIVKLK